MAGTKTVTRQPKNGNGSTVIYDDMINDLSELTKNANYAREIEGSVLNEARGREAWALHATLKAVSVHDAEEAQRASNLEVRLDDLEARLNDHADRLNAAVGNADATATSHFDKTWTMVKEQHTGLVERLRTDHDTLTEALSEGRAATRNEVESAIDTLTDVVGNAQGELKGAVNAVDDRVAETRGAILERVEGNESAILSRVTDIESRLITTMSEVKSDLRGELDNFREVTSENFDATNKRVRTEVEEVRDEVTSLIDKRFNHVDQTFASIRGDLEVLKALVMELIKERIGRPEIKDR